MSDEPIDSGKFIKFILIVIEVFLVIAFIGGILDKVKSLFTDLPVIVRLLMSIVGAYLLYLFANELD